MVILLLDRFYPLLIFLCMCYTTDGNVPKNRFQKMSFKYFNNRKIFRKKLTTTQNDFEIDFQATAYMQWTVWFDFAQRNSSLQKRNGRFSHYQQAKRNDASSYFWYGYWYVCVESSLEHNWCGYSFQTTVCSCHRYG